MRRVWTTRVIDAPAEVVWDLIVDPVAWPRWGPSVRRAVLDDDRLRQGSRGTVTTVVGVDVPFEVVAFEQGSHWSWAIAGVGATDHEVRACGPGRCRAGIGVPWLAAPYLAVCRVALRRLESLALQRAAAR